VGATIACAVDDALGIPGAIAALPITPQRIKQILDGKR
jgi:CO/xanthine dehydrogenase Mo-binding subunit